MLALYSLVWWSFCLLDGIDYQLARHADLVQHHSLLRAASYVAIGGPGYAPAINVVTRLASVALLAWLLSRRRPTPAVAASLALAGGLVYTGSNGWSIGLAEPNPLSLDAVIAGLMGASFVALQHVAMAVTLVGCFRLARGLASRAHRLSHAARG